MLHNKSLEHIDIDPDDGVKVNYGKFGNRLDDGKTIIGSSWDGNS
ncbi:MAG: hypothetical protein U9N09_06425 [Euryarchaeota archaeon]|nr:hypothetical protein [Euryarchaeota archaeon]